MAEIRVAIVNAFTTDSGGGNPAGVVLDADGLDAAARQKVAAAVGLSETAFIGRSDEPTVRMEFYTPNRPIADCGHATVATFGYLRGLGRLGDGVHRKEIASGVQPVRIDGELTFMGQRRPELTGLDALGMAPGDVAALLGLPRAALGAVAPAVVDNGVRFLALWLGDAADLAAARPDQAAIEALSERLDLIGVYAGAPPVAAGTVATARMFAPRYGIPEESATGMGAGTLAALLHARGVVAADRFVIEQGRYMDPPAPSLIKVELDIQGGALAAVHVGGRVRVMREMTVTV
ncbi:MAG TPA: PhzF family phenazine biosynthesis protein [Alphaproteobacteria bacterium]|nr:PhzF family phenazine biosynthesis protein [Alphaproteobacteria bacterium]